MLGAVKNISKWLIISCYLPLALAPSYVAANDIELGLDHYLNGDYKSAMAHWRPLAETGDEVAEFYLGIMYENGRAVPQDAGQAAIWYRRAADQNLAKAQYYLSRLYSDGRGVAQDDALAVMWLRRAASQNYPEAQRALSLKYTLGEGVPQDYLRAYMWLTLATRAGAKIDSQTKNFLEHQLAGTLAKAQQMARACEDNNFQDC